MPTLSPPSRRPPALTLAGMNRPLGPTEAIYYLLDQLYSLNFVVFAEVSGRLDAGGLERALQAVQVEQPLLRTHLAVVRGRAGAGASAGSLGSFRRTMPLLFIKSSAM